MREICLSDLAVWWKMRYNESAIYMTCLQGTEDYNDADRENSRFICTFFA